MEGEGVLGIEGGGEVKGGDGEGGRLTLFATVPLILPINTIEPPFPEAIICLATACAVMNTPVTLISNIRLSPSAPHSPAFPGTLPPPTAKLKNKKEKTHFASSAVYSIAGVSCCIPAAAISP